VGIWGKDGWAVRPGEGERVELGGPHWLEVLVQGADVDQALGAFIFTHDMIEENPPHAHFGFMKIAYMLEGQYDFRVGDATFSGGPGTVVVIPKGSQHTFTTLTGGRMLFVSSPAGNEEDVPGDGPARPGRHAGTTRGNQRALPDPGPARRRVTSLETAVVSDVENGFCLGDVSSTPSGTTSSAPHWPPSQ
jgi:quercetin dioxygenase-like cupin family protein